MEHEERKASIRPRGPGFDIYLRPAFPEDLEEATHWLTKRGWKVEMEEDWTSGS